MFDILYHIITDLSTIIYTLAFIGDKIDNFAQIYLCNLFLQNRLTNLSPCVIVIMLTDMSTSKSKERWYTMDLILLNSKIDEIKIPITTIAEKMGISRQTFYLKMSGQREFKASEIEKICDILRLTDDEKSSIFFSDRVDKSDN